MLHGPLVSHRVSALCPPPAVLQELRPRAEEAKRVLPKRRPRRGGARQHVQTEPATQSPGELRPAPLPKERQAAVDAYFLGRGKDADLMVTHFKYGGSSLDGTSLS